MSKKLDIIILAAGRSRRFNSAIPKVIQETCGRPFVYYLARSLERKEYAGSLIFVLGYQFDRIKETLQMYFNQIKFVRQKSLNGSAGAVRAAERAVSRTAANVLVVCGDTLLLESRMIDRLYRRHLKEGNHCTFLVCRSDKPQDLGRVVLSDTGDFVSIKENKDLSPAQRRIPYVNTGIYIFKKDALFTCLPYVKKNRRKGEYFLTDVLGIMRQRGMKIGMLQLATCRDILLVNRRSDLAAAEEQLRRRKIAALMRKGVRIIDPPSTFIYPEASIGRDTVIYPFTFIENDVKIGRYCRIGPFAHIRSFTQVKDKAEIGNFAEVVRSYIGKDVKMKHFSYMGDTKVGDRVNVGAGSVVANYDGRNKHKSSIGTGAFIGSNSTLIAPVKIGRGSITGAGSVVRKKVPDHTVVVGVPAKILRRKK